MRLESTGTASGGWRLVGGLVTAFSALPLPLFVSVAESRLSLTTAGAEAAG
jgi:hypothetical protein